ncbi:hypothetical protein BN1221_04291c [Brenneria goodwinii]|uniref:Uncharacterized protein n=1 Tax=Brenneria goodwinii TaxID=1109412 RepID=A0A0G4K0P7_9GAMM|nr:hypothetical protein BN1221_04291c [Brenneria goodwinii]
MMAQAVKQGLKTRRRWSARANGISGGKGDAGYRRGSEPADRLWQREI